VAKEALNRAAFKLPVRCRFVVREQSGAAVQVAEAAEAEAAAEAVEVGADD
jgi:hypothetical protein